MVVEGKHLFRPAPCLGNWRVQQVEMGVQRKDRHCYAAQGPPYMSVRHVDSLDWVLLLMYCDWQSFHSVVEGQMTAGRSCSTQPSLMPPLVGGKHFAEGKK